MERWEDIARQRGAGVYVRELYKQYERADVALTPQK